MTPIKTKSTKYSKTRKSGSGIIKTFSDLFFKNFQVKLGTFIFAFLTWLIIILGNQYNYSFEVPLEIVNIEDGKILKEKIADNITADFSGRGADFVALLLSPKSSFKFVLDLRRISWYYDYALKQYYKQNPEKIITPRNTAVKFEKIVWPDTIHIELDKYAETIVPVVSKLDFKVSPGYTIVGKQIIEPDTIIISGPRTYVKKYKEIFTENKILENISTPVELDLELVIPESDNIKITHKQVRVFQNIEQIGEKIITDIPIRVLNTPQGINVNIVPSTISLNISAGISLLKSIQSKDIYAFFNYSRNWQAGKKSYEPEIRLPEGVLSVNNIAPETIDVRVFRERSP